VDQAASGTAGAARRDHQPRRRCAGHPTCSCRTQGQHDAHLARSKSITPHDGGWIPLAPSPISFHPGAADPHAPTAGEIADIAGQFANAAGMACEAGMQVVEIHAAHRYLLHSFLSPIREPLRRRLWR
jgi:2,4-dienoyl-CoA reductase-like NADH-dependent reductase (Old Yellow Enzyme family)